jgi:uncharacterized protein
MFRKLFFISIFVLIGVVGVSTAFAEAKYSIKKMTPDVQQALDQRRDRFDQLRQLKSTGALGENNRGYVEVLKNEGPAQSIASAENNDRRTIFQTIAEQNGLQGALATIEAVFAQVQRDKADAGDQIQMPDGRWVKQ